jgi:hypothetical protein
VEGATLRPLRLAFNPVLLGKYVVIGGLADHRAFQILPAHGVDEASSIQQKTTVIRVWKLQRSVATLGEMLGDRYLSIPYLLVQVVHLLLLNSLQRLLMVIRGVSLSRFSPMLTISMHGLARLMYTLPFRRFFLVPRGDMDWWRHFGDHLTCRLLD